MGPTCLWEEVEKPELGNRAPCLISELISLRYLVLVEPFHLASPSRTNLKGIKGRCTDGQSQLGAREGHVMGFITFDVSCSPSTTAIPLEHKDTNAHGMEC